MDWADEKAKSMMTNSHGDLVRPFTIQIAQALREAEARGMERAAAICKTLKERNPKDDEDYGYNNGLDAAVIAIRTGAAKECKDG